MIIHDGLAFKLASFFIEGLGQIINSIVGLHEPSGGHSLETGEVWLGKGNVVVDWDFLILGVAEDEDDNILDIGLIGRLLADCRLVMEC